MLGFRLMAALLLLLRLKTIFERRLASLVVIFEIFSIAVTAEPPPASSPL